MELPAGGKSKGIEAKEWFAAGGISGANRGFLHFPVINLPVIHNWNQAVLAAHWGLATLDRQPPPPEINSIWRWAGRW